MTNPHQSWHPTDSVISEVDRKHLAIVGEYLETPPHLIKHQRLERDPDYDPINSIYSRLPSKSPSPSPRRQRVVHITCECHKVGQTSGSGKQHQKKDQGSSEEDTDEEEEDVDLGVLLKLLDGLSKRPDGRISSQAFNGVLEGFSCEESVSHDKLEKVCEYLESGNLRIKQMTWSLISKLCGNLSNVTFLLKRNFLKNIIQAVSSSSESLGPCVDTIISVVSHESLREDWYEWVLSDIVPLLLTALSMEDVTLDHKYRIGCFFHCLGKDQDFLGIIENRVLPIISGLRNSSAKLKEIYTKILGEVVKNEDSGMSSSVDQGVTGVAVSMLKEGPCDQQIEALSLLCILSETERGRATVINDEDILPTTLTCVQQSKCRIVRQRALVLMNHVTSTRRLGLCKEVMSHISYSLLPSQHTDRHTDKPPIRGRQEREGRLWRGMEGYVEMLTKIFCKEAKIEKNNLQKVVKCGYWAGCDVQLLVNCSSAILNVCLWPAHRNKQDLNSLDLTSFTDCEDQRKKYGKINRALVQMVWDSFGECMFELLTFFSRKLRNILDLALQARGGKNLCSEHEAKSASGLKVLDRLGFADLYAVFEEKEVDLVVILLELVLVMSLCSCKGFSDLFPTSSKSKKKSSPVSSKSVSSTQGGYYNSRPGSPLKSRPTSAVGLSSLSEEERCQGLKDKEISAERRLLRKCLFEQGVFGVVVPFIQCSHLQCQIFSCEILRANIQSIEEREITLNSMYGPVNASANARLRPQSAAAALTRDLRVKQALHTMSPHVAHIIKDALGPRLAPSTPHVIPRAEEEPDTEAITRLSQYVIENRPSSRQVDPIPEVPKPVLDPVKPVAVQCREQLLQEGGSRILTPMLSSSLEVKKLCALLLGDLVHFGNVDVHMTLTQLGYMQKLLDFLRTNTSNELLEIIGLIIVQMLVKSDKRIEQVFNHHGGTRFLMAMVKFTSGDLKKQVVSTLKTVTHGTKKTRPSSAPVSQSRKTLDIWDKIQQEWAHQDKVEDILHQWYR
ncbi:uncharacterized protein LOC133195609 [Saccostrea echinata]|uniref:uncharacterized protein LOC133195609 n=1 Tax=Saccostrea echinata TaxID=191078 RepID=UPI002A817EF7|nr:uncharacterized protein LOC133195609 [Saccostrea echinata]